MNKKQVRVGMVGYKFMGKAHSHAFRDLPFYFDTEAVPVLQAIAGRDAAGVREAAEKMGWASWETDWRRLIERDDIDLIAIVTPNNTHAEIAIAAAQAGKHVICEKPLALTVGQALHMLEAVKKAGVVHMVCHNYRLGVFEATRSSRGNRAGNRFEINGEKGSIRWDMENLNHLQVYLEEDEPGLQGFRTISCTEVEHPFAAAYWPAGHIIGYEHTFINLLAEMMNGISTGVSPSPNFEDGVRNQIVLEAVEQSVQTGQWVKLPEYTGNLPSFKEQSMR
ncbi:Gfo/Idh/MocA family oxidoreductase [Brevibacillus sp. WF146]|uniref:Gfo/Idh/MocA family protein n=1 Tax=Brevibacillus sp. WF146 TaxID=319501 RepID=UPI0007EDA1F4|nr:Gfo/Idh/MocA family oxidoreductase [Brevibacillus sp. WF146]UYZ14786.1 Gfo/Idh/MocA family oxidoreductase [Brevibacillus sp. WF146]